MIVAYCWLCRHRRNLAEGGCLLRDLILRAVLLFEPCRLSEFTLAGPHTVGR